MPGIVLGESLLFKIICWLTLGSLPDNYNLIMHPIAFAGWIGLLVTNINLIPVGQLDGGHVSYALFGDRSEQIAKLFYLLLIIIGLLWWYGWLVWVVLLYFMGFKHPPPLETWVPLDRKRRAIGYLTSAVFILTFMPAPFIIQ
jgi:membrane-associated protease RseP (regulator of RpoE activity)